MVDQVVVDGEHRLSKLAERFQHWRTTKTRRGDPIPDSLWVEVHALSEVLPQRQICRTLRLSDSDVKKRLGAGQPTPHQTSTPSLSFVEMTDTLSHYTAMPSTVADVTFERPDGARLQVHYSGSIAELAPLVQRFLTAR